MKSQEENARIKIQDAVYALASTWFTNLIFGQMNKSHYEMTDMGSYYYVAKVRDTSFWITLFQLVFLFLIVLFVLSRIMPRLYTLFLTMRRSILRVYTEKEAFAIYREVRGTILMLSKELDDSSLEQSKRILYSEELLNQIMTLYQVFCPTGKMSKFKRERTFRNYSTVVDIGERITPYEFEALISICTSLVSKVNTSGISDAGFAHDCEEIKDILEKLKDVPKKKA